MDSTGVPAMVASFPRNLGRWSATSRSTMSPFGALIRVVYPVSMPGCVSNPQAARTPHSLAMPRRSAMRSASRSASVVGRAVNPPMMACNWTMSPPVSSHDSDMSAAATAYTVLHGWPVLGMWIVGVIPAAPCGGGRRSAVGRFSGRHGVPSGRWIRPGRPRTRREASILRRRGDCR